MKKNLGGDDEVDKFEQKKSILNPTSESHQDEFKKNSNLKFKLEHTFQFNSYHDQKDLEKMLIKTEHIVTLKQTNTNTNTQHSTTPPGVTKN